MRKINTLSLFLLFLSLITCNDRVRYSTNPNDALVFSADTVRFDTIFSTIGSSTQRLKVFNPHAKGLIIEQIMLENAMSSGFRINVDGRRGMEFANIEILPRDSMYIFVEVTAKPTSQDSPLLQEDYIRFRLNGAQQKVLLEAYGQDAHIWKKKIIAADTTLTGEKPFLIYDSLIVRSSATLSLKENVRLFFHKNAGLYIEGKIDARGTVNQPVVMRGDRSDKLLPKITYDRIPGQWSGVEIDSLSFDNYFENVCIRNAVNGIRCNPSVENPQKATILNTVIHNLSANGIWAKNCAIDVKNAQITNSKGATVYLWGGKYSFLHCTIANYFSWDSRQGVALVISNESKENNTPVNRCALTNSIVEGNQRTEVDLKNSGKSAFNHLFTRCVIKAKGGDDQNFVRTLWTDSTSFVYLNKEGDYRYDFHLDSMAIAKDKADRNYSLSLPYDLNGISRLTDENPDIGCYEWMPSKGL